MIKGIFGGGAAAGSGAFAGSVASAVVGHTGGVVGVDSLPKRKFIPSFSSVPKYHEGLGANEVLAVLKKKETVFTEGQMKALSGMVGGGTTTAIDVGGVTVNPDNPRLASWIRTEVEDGVKRALRRVT